MTYNLRLESNGEEHEILDGAIVGRDPSADIVLSSPTVSRHHARFEAEAGLLYVHDLGSTNGTFVNGKRIAVRTLCDDATVIRLGSKVLTVINASGDTGKAAMCLTGLDPARVARDSAAYAAAFAAMCLVYPAIGLGCTLASGIFVSQLLRSRG
ncbi:MAG: hypothetical protein AMXMBFR19_01620 [Chthonomonadaceae bacterium]|uniref:FHA domain-containing protein n=1 Tax=Candidatus Nitrosymbiomonas proteolyticus TaxID=2608984 RepID=A0A809RET7_9BACT|nr:conserved hypothetical protein [Candidatus Nitrosymbiomonas proteolyticus]